MYSIEMDNNVLANYAGPGTTDVPLVYRHVMLKPRKDFKVWG